MVEVEFAVVRLTCCTDTNDELLTEDIYTVYTVDDVVAGESRYVVEQEPADDGLVVLLNNAISSKPIIDEPPLYKRNPIVAFELFLYVPAMLTNTRILLDVLLGVIEAVKPVDIYVTVELPTWVEVVPLTTCNTLPAGRAAATTPVQLVSTPLAGVPSAGATRVLLVSV